MEVISCLVGQHPGKRWQKMPIMFPVPYYYSTTTLSTLWVITCWFVHQPFNSCPGRLRDAHDYRDNILCINGEQPARNVFGLLLRPGRNAHSLSLLPSTGSLQNISGLQCIRKLLLHWRISRMIHFLTTPRLVMAYWVRLCWWTISAMTTLTGRGRLSHSTLECIISLSWIQ